MNQSLNALMTKLTWQQDELSQHLLIAEKDSLLWIEQLHELEKTINESCVSPQVINPEFEINRLNFLTQTQQQKAELAMNLKNAQDLESKLQDKLQRIKTERRMLEKYLEREQLVAKALFKKNEEHAMDEWILQRRESI